VRIHERADHMRAYGAAIFAWYNLMRVLKAVGADGGAVAGGSPFVVRDPHAILKLGAQSKWLMSHRQRAAHHVPTGAEAFAPRATDM
jgi:hypothetical protein